jgi:hypothetical protein
MESFHTAFLLVSPPTCHPIHTLHLRHIGQIDALSPLSEWPNLRRIALRCKWNEIDFRGRNPFVLSSDKLRVEDREGVTLDEYYRLP